MALISMGSAHADSARWTALADDDFQHYNGLPDTSATALAQDGEGFIWVGTQGGLARWDGYRFRSYQPDPKNPGALPDGFIEVLHTDPRGRLWVGTSAGGLARYEPARDGFVTYRAGPGGLSHSDVRAIGDDGHGGLWIATDGGLDHLDPDTGAIRSLHHDAHNPGSLPNDRVETVLRDRAGRLWVGTQAGLARQDREDGPFVPVALFARPEGASVRALFEDDTGRIWIGTEHHGAYILDAASLRVRPIEEGDAGGSLRSEYISAIGATVQGQMWLGTHDAGLVAVDTATGKTRRIRHDPVLPTSLAHDSVWAILRDRAGTTWIASLSGLDRLTNNDDAILTLFGAPERERRVTARDVVSVQPMADGSIWLGLFGGGGVNLIDPAEARVTRLPTPQSPGNTLSKATVSALAAGGGAVYVGTERGLYRVDHARTAIRRLTPPKRDPNSLVSTILVEPDILWIGGPDGLWKTSIHNGTLAALEHWDDRLTDLRINTIARGTASDLWVGTFNGLNRLDLATGALERILPNPSEPSALAAGYVSSLLFDRTGRLWVGMSGGISVLMSRGADGRPRFRRIGTADGLPNASVDKLLQDGQGRIWASTDDGLAVIDPDTFAVRSLHRAEGLAVTGYWVGSGAVTSEGELLFGGMGGLTVVRPERLTDWNYRPPVVVTEARVGGKPLPAGRFNGKGSAEPLVITPQANSLAVEFSALDYTAPERNRYAYRLDGFDKDWVETDTTRRVAAYTNLPPGSYSLHLRGSNRDGVWTERILELPLRVLPAWYEILWFKLAVGLAASAAIAALVRTRTAVLRRQQKALERQVEARTAEVVRQKTLIEQAYSELQRTQAALVQREKLVSLGQLVAGVAHEVSTPVGVALSASTQISEEVGRFDGVIASGRLRRTDLADFTATLSELSGVLARNCERAGSLIQSFKAVAADQSSDERRRFDLRTCVEDVVASLGPALARTPVKLLIESTDQFTLDSFPGALSQVLINLVTNALMHAFASGQAGLITIRIGPGGADHAELTVSDDGSGIAPGVLPKIFDPFFTTRRGAGGTGLGLHIVHNLVIGSLGGTLSVRTEPGAGTTFVLLLPLEAPSRTGPVI